MLALDSQWEAIVSVEYVLATILCFFSFSRFRMFLGSRSGQKLTSDGLL